MLLSQMLEGRRGAVEEEVNALVAALSVDRSRILRLVVEGRWFDMLNEDDPAKRKDHEYRAEKWAPRLLEPCAVELMPIYKAKKVRIPQFRVKPYLLLELARGYTKTVIWREILAITWGTPRPEWSGSTIAEDCFIFHLGRKIPVTHGTCTTK